MPAQDPNATGLHSLAKETRDEIYTLLIPDGQIVKVVGNKALLYKQDRISGKYVHVGDGDFYLDIFGTSQEMREFLLGNFYEKQKMLFTKPELVAKFVVTVSPRITQSIVQLNLQFIIPDNRMPEIVLQHLILSVGDLTICNNLQNVNVSIILPICEIQVAVGDELWSWVREAMGLSFNVCVTATECRHCVEDLDSNLETKTDDTQLLAVKGCSQLWQWTCARDTNQWEVARYLIDKTTRVRLVGFSDMIANHENNLNRLVAAGQDTTAAISTISTAGIIFRHLACGNDTCQNTCTSIPADLRDARRSWCQRCELVAGCDVCSFMGFQHGDQSSNWFQLGDFRTGCLAKPLALDATRAEQLRSRKMMHRSILSIYKNEYGMNLDKFMRGEDVHPLHDHTITVDISASEFTVSYDRVPDTA